MPAPPGDGSNWWADSRQKAVNPAGARGGSTLGWVRRSPYFRRGVQCGLGTAALVALCSPAAVSRSLTIDTPSNSTTSPAAFILVNFYFLLLVSSSSGQSPLQVGLQQLLGNLLGGALAIAAMFITYGVNGGSYHDSFDKALAMVLCSAVVLFCVTVCRFHYRQYALLFLFLSITFAMTTSSSYHATTRFYQFTFYWWAYSAIGSAVAFLCATFILPISAGTIVRRRLAAGLQHAADVASAALDIMSGEVDSDSGLLTAASGETSELIGLDSGLQPQLSPLYTSVLRASMAFRDAYNYLPYAPHWLELYRRQRRFPRRPFWLLVILARSFLNTIMMMVYPTQTGTLHVTLISRRRPQLLALAQALTDACRLLGDVLVQNAPISGALEAVRVVETRYVALATASRFKGRALSQEAVALDLVLSLLFTAVTRLRRMSMLLPEALGADQPRSLDEVLAHFRVEGEGEGAGQAPAWSFMALTQVPAPGGGVDGDPIEQLRASLLAAKPKYSASRQALALLSPPDVLELPHTLRQESALRRVLHWLPAQLGVSPKAFKLALQLLAAYTTVLVMVVVPEVNNAFVQSLNWSLFVIVSVIEPSTGAAIFKAIQRLLGTLLAGCLGVATQYLVFLCNGLSYSNGALKSSAMAACLGLLAFGAAAGGVKFPCYSYFFIIGAVTLGLTALPGYQTDSPEPEVALWRAITTALGVVMEVLAVSLILPVTARRSFQDLMAGTLDQLSAVSRTAFQAALPRPLRCVGLSKSTMLPVERQQRWWWRRWGPPAPPPKLSAMSRRRSHEEQQQQLAAAAAAEEEARGVELHPWRRQQQQRLLRRKAQERQEGGGQQEGEVNGEAAACSPTVSQLGHSGHQHVVLEVQNGQSSRSSSQEQSSSAQLELPPLRVKRVNGLEQQQQHPLTRCSHLQPPQATGFWGQMPTTPLTPLGSTGSTGFPRRQTGGSTSSAPSLASDTERQQGVGQSPRTGRSPRPRLQRSQSLSSDVSAHLSIYASRQANLKVMGTSYALQLPDLMGTADRIVAMFQLRTALNFEWYPLNPLHRFPFKPGFRAQRLCRHLLNVVASVPTLLDSHDVAALPMLAPFASRLHLVVEQLAVCLEALAGMVRGEHTPQRAVDVVLSLEEHVQRLFLVVLADFADQPAKEGSEGGLSEGDVITGLAYLAVLCNAAYVVRLLCIALIRTFHATDPGASRAESALLDHPNRWAMDDRMLHLLTGVLGIAVGSSASGSGGPVTPRHGGWEGPSAHGGLAATSGGASPPAP